MAFISFIFYAFINPFPVAMANNHAEAAELNDKAALEQEVDDQERDDREKDEDFTALFDNWNGVAKEKGQKESRRHLMAVPMYDPLSILSVSSDFGMRLHPIVRRRKMHKGVDLAAPSGTPIYATADGVVVTSRYSRSFGNFVEINHGGGIVTRYGHMSRRGAHMHQRVEKGDIIGYVGSTGRSMGNHLHYEVTINGQAIDPAVFIPGLHVLPEEEGGVQVAGDDERSFAIGGPSGE